MLNTATISPTTDTTIIKGIVLKVIFRNEKTGFNILSVKQSKPVETINVQLNYTDPIEAGFHIECQGEWVNHSQYGHQFKAHHAHVSTATPQSEIEKYLHSGLFKGIGQDIAKKIVDMFGDNTFDILQNHPEQLTKIAGIGKQRKNDIQEQWQKHQAVHELALFLQPHGISASRTVRIHKHFGKQSLEKIKHNPYQLTQFSRIGFHTADHIARKLGLASDSIERITAGIEYTLQQFCEQGHCAMPYTDLLSESTNLLELEQALIAVALQQAVAQKNFMIEMIDDAQHVFLTSFYRAENQVVEHMQRLVKGELPWKKLKLKKLIKWVEEKTKLQLSDSQKNALFSIFEQKISIITGGPGVGKTTLVNSILMLLRKNKLKIELCAPTGRAAKRLSETTGLPAKTIHRLLGFDFISNSFTHNIENPLTVDVLIIDESSMVDLKLFLDLLKAIPSHTAMILVGDVDQLPSVGSGAVLADLIQSTTIQTIYLTEIFRQATHSKIVVNAHRINQKQQPLPNDKESDFYIIKVTSPKQMQTELLELVTARLPSYLDCDPIHDIQVLTPMHRGHVGTQALNKALQERLNNNLTEKIEHYESNFYVGDKVIQTVNNYDKDIFNGDIGTVCHINSKNKTLKIQFDTKIIEYRHNALNEISLAYAITIHKSQGSEYPVIVIPLTTEHKRLLAKNLLYTGVTRGKKFVVLIIEEKALHYAIQNNTASQRITKLKQRLQAAFGKN